MRRGLQQAAAILSNWPLDHLRYSRLFGQLQLGFLTEFTDQLLQQVTLLPASTQRSSSGCARQHAQLTVHKDSF